MTRLRDLDPAALGDAAHEHVLGRILALVGAIDPAGDPAPILAALGGRSEVRRCVAALAVYARDGAPPEGRPELVREYLVSLVGAEMLPDDLDPDDEPDDDGPLADVHRVVLAVLARERLRDGEAVPSAWLAALASVTPAAVRQLIAGGELRRWRAGDARGSRRAYVRADDARRWLAARVVPGIAAS